MNNNTEDTVFAEDKIVLLDGRELECFPKSDAEESIDNNLSLDKTGQYLSTGSKPMVKSADQENKEEQELFLKNAFLFYNNAEGILNNSRMFLAPVPFQSGLAYSGTSGFRKPTLGVYIEWWLSCKEVDLTKDKDGNEALTYHIAGSPLSGSNRCSCVYPDGHSEEIMHRPFLPIWTTFIDINTRYDPAKVKYDSYTLEEVINRLL